MNFHKFVGDKMNGREEQIQVVKNIRQVNRRLDRIEAEMSVIVAALKKKKLTSLDIGLRDLAMGRVHRYKSAKELASDIWG